jgi:hypothetical protein
VRVASIAERVCPARASAVGYKDRFGVPPCRGDEQQRSAFVSDRLIRSPSGGGAHTDRRQWGGVVTVARCPDRSIRDSSVAGRDHNEGERDRERTPPCSLLSHLKFFIGSDSMLPPVVRARRARATYCQVQSVGTCTITFIVQQNPLPVAYSKRNMPVRSSLISMNF